MVGCCHCHNFKLYQLKFYFFCTEKALEIYKKLPTNYRRPMAEIHYKIGLTYLMQQLNKEGAASLKEACNLIAGEIEEMKAKTDLTDKDKNNIQDMEETKQEIEAKIIEIEETQAQVGWALKKHCRSSVLNKTQIKTKVYPSYYNNH